jgi:magnesium-transporting ATPase (P-type)
MKKALKDIYFYNARALASELNNDSVTEYRAVKHMVAAIILGGIGFEIPISVSPEETNSSIFQFGSYVVFFIITAIISYYGVWLTYQVNKKGDGKDYFLRFSVLTLPVGIQLFVLFLWVGLALVVLSFALLSTLGAVGAYLMMLLFYVVAIAFIIMFFTRMRTYIAIASGANE